jgi:glycosyltransferase involved in cell wall biosynthesis
VKFAFVTPRYGADIASGADHGARLLAEQVCERHDIDVLTTCARDPRTWKNEFAEGADRVRGVLVRRFPVAQPHDRPAFEQLTRRLLAGPHGRAEALEWVRKRGPWSPALLEHLKRQQRSYDAIVFFSLCEPTTVYGLPIAPERSIVFPYLQWDPVLRFGLWSELLSSARAIGLFSLAERTLLREYLRVTSGSEEVVGIGIDPPPQQSYPRHQQDPADTLVADDSDEAPAEAQEAPTDSYLDARGAPFRRRHRLYGTLALYGGRVEPDNGCEEMLEYFDSYAAADGDASLVLMGVKMMKVPEQRYLRLAGVLPERERMVAYEAADVTIAPASDDLMAQSLLESLAVGTPVLASARNEAAADHCRRANAGLYYADGQEFVEALRLLTRNRRLSETLGENGRNYVRQNYRWDAVVGRFERLIGRVRSK